MVDDVSVHKRPKHVKGCRTLGHWEGDLVTGIKNPHTVRLLDSKSRHTVMFKLKAKGAMSITKALIKNRAS